MRKMALFVLIFVFSIIPFLALATDYSSLSDEELVIEFKLIKEEINKRGINPDADGQDNKILSQYKDMTLSFSAVEEMAYNGALLVWYTAINNGDKPVRIYFDEIKINGWGIGPLFDSISLEPGEKKKDKIIIFEYCKKTDIKSVDEIEELELFSHGENQKDKSIVMKVYVK